MTDRFYVLAFDIERSGGGGEHSTISIGACVLDRDFVVQDTLLKCCYRWQGVRFEPRCKKEFWSKHADVLAAIKEQTPTEAPLYPDSVGKAYMIPMGQKGTEKLATLAFIEFVAKWETRAESEGVLLYRTTDNAAYDVHFINELIEEHAPEGTLPLPYTMCRNAEGKQAYAALYDVHQRQLGFLAGMQAFMGVNPDKVDKMWTREFWGASGAVAGIGAALTGGLPIPPPERKATHMPDDDAYEIAYEMVALLTVERDLALGRRTVKENVINQ